MQNAALIIFAKAPLAGSAKTRLIPTLGAEGAARLHAKLVSQCVAQNVFPQQWDTFLFCAPDCKHALFQGLQQRYAIELREQQGRDLGERMYHAFESLFDAYRHVIIIGTDCPQLHATFIAEVFAALQSNIDAFMAPAEDGGYVLMGLNKLHKEIFSDIDWSTAQVMTQTRARMRTLAFHWQESETFWDVDRPDDLLRLQQSGFELDQAFAKDVPSPPDRV